LILFPRQEKECLPGEGNTINSGILSALAAGRYFFVDPSVILTDAGSPFRGAKS
jgi:hypothetical protein